MNPNTKNAIIYLCLIFVLFLLFGGAINLAIKQPILKIAVASSFLGGVGSVVYCMRGIYLHSIKNNDHDSKFDSWFYLRPYVGMFRGLICSFGLLLCYLGVKRFFPGGDIEALDIILILFVSSVEGYKPFITKFLLS
jgi:energy-converting hydrogenase Eha subunit C